VDWLPGWGLGLDAMKNTRPFLGDDAHLMNPKTPMRAGSNARKFVLA
jgi:hypothetical protein